MIFRIIRQTLVVVGLFVLFFIWTFPTERLGPKLANLIAKQLSVILPGAPADCDIQSLGFALPIGVKMNALSCRAGSPLPFLDLKNVSLRLIPFNQTASADLGSGHVELSSNASLLSFKPSKIGVRVQKLNLEKATPLVTTFLPPQMRMFITSDFKIFGTLDADIQAPTGQLYKSSGLLNLTIKDLTLPRQSILEQVGLQDLKFTSSQAKITLTNGKLDINNFEFLSDTFSQKASGSFQFLENIEASTGSIDLKWQVTASDALRNSFLGRRLLEAPCPNPDSQRFCTRRLTKFSDLQNLLSFNTF